MRSGLIDRWAARILGRAESRSISDTLGGLIVDCRLIWWQTASIIAMLLLDFFLLLFWLWALPPVMWQYALYAAYFVVSFVSVVQLPRVIGRTVRVMAQLACTNDDLAEIRRASWRYLPSVPPTVRVVLSLGYAVVVIIGAAVVFHYVAQAPIQQFALSFFGLKVPACEVWAYGLLLLAPLGILLVAKGWSAIGGLLVVTSLYGVYLMITSDVTAPGLMFYVSTLVIMVCFWFGTFWAIWRFVREIRDEYKPQHEEESDTLGDIVDEFRAPRFTSSKRESGKPLEM